MNVDPLTTPHRCPTSLRVFVRLLQYFFLAAILTGPAAGANELQPGNVYPLTFTDVDGQQLSTADGHVTIITVLTRKDEEKAEQVGDRVPHVYLGDPKYRLITLVNFQKGMFPLFHGMINAIIRNRMDAAAKDLQKNLHGQESHAQSALRYFCRGGFRRQGRLAVGHGADWVGVRGFCFRWPGPVGSPVERRAERGGFGRGVERSAVSK